MPLEEPITLGKILDMLLQYTNAIIVLHFLSEKNDFDKHVRVYGKKPGVVYDFSLQNVVTFEDNIKYKGDLPFCTAPTGDYLNPENNSMFAVSYALVFAWHPKLELGRHMIVRGYNHSLEELADVSYLTSEQLAMRNLKHVSN